MVKENYCLYLVKEDYEAFEKLCKQQLSGVSREVNLFMRDFIKQHAVTEGKSND